MIQSTASLQQNPDNPRVITDDQLAALRLALIEFGDLSGLVLNRATGNLIGGNQRLKVLTDAPITITHRYKKATPHGTVAEGYATYEGEHFVYREVEWSPTKEKAAMIAANKHGGDWEFPKLTDLLVELDAAGVDLSFTGFDAKELEKLNVIEGDEPEPPPPNENNVRSVQLFLTTETLPPFMEKIKLLGETFALENITDTVCKAVEESYDKHREDTPTVVTDTEQRVKRGRGMELDDTSMGDKATRRKKLQRLPERRRLR